MHITELETRVLQLLQLRAAVHKQLSRDTVPRAVALESLDDSLGRKSVQGQNVRRRGKQADNNQGVARERLPAVDGGFGLE